MNLDTLNSATKYPSIPTYHVLGERGILTTTRNVEFKGAVIATEKIDGANARIIVTPHETFIGSRNELLWCVGDRVHNPAQGIVDTLRETAMHLERERIAASAESGCRIHVFFFEVFGGNICKASKQYTSKGEFSYRMFDAFSATEDMIPDTPEAAAKWRDDCEQPWASENRLASLALLTCSVLTPRVCAQALTDNEIPKDRGNTLAWLRALVPMSCVQLDPFSGGKSEGLVVRSECRKHIAKIRFKDYERWDRYHSLMLKEQIIHD